MPDVNADPVKNAEDIYHSYLAGGPESAVQNMRNEYEASKSDFKSPQQHDQYWQAVSKELEETGHLPNLTAAFLKENKAEFDLDRDGVISKHEVNDVSRNGGFAGIFADNLKSTVPSPKGDKSFYDQLAHTVKPWEVNRDVIEDVDLNRWDRQNNRVLKRELKHNMAADAASPLYENDGALMKAVDASHKENGRLSRSDYKAFLRDYEQKAASGQQDEVYNERNARFIYGMLKGDEPTLKHGPFRGINIDKLDRRTGNGPQDDFTPHQDVPNGGISDAAFDREQQLAQEKIEAETPKKNKDVCDGELKNIIDDMARVRTNEGYSHVACRLLDIKIDHKYTAEEKHEMDVLAKQLKNITTGHNTLRLYDGFIMPVSNNLAKLEEINPSFKRRMDALREQIEQ